MRKNPFLFLIMLVVFCSLHLNAQKNIETQNHLWVRYQLKINYRYQDRQEIEERTFWFPWRQYQFVSRTHGEQKLGKGWNVAVSFTHFLQATPQKPEAKVCEKLKNCGLN